jgi:hypothetical protein
VVENVSGLLTGIYPMLKFAWWASASLMCSFVIVAADVLLWRNKKISSSVLALATAIWVFFEWLDYHFLTIVSFALVLGMVVQFVWSNFSNMLSSG